MKCALLCTALLLGRFSCSFTHVDEDGEDKTRIEFVSNPMLGPLPAVRLDGDALWAAGTVYRVRGDALEILPGHALPDGLVPDCEALLEDRDGDGRIDLILVDGALFWVRAAGPG